MDTHVNPHLTPLFIQVHSTQAVFARTKHLTREVVFYLAWTPLFGGNKENIDCLCLVVRAGVIIEAGDRKLKIIATFQQHFSTITFHPAVSFPLSLSFSIIILQWCLNNVPLLQWRITWTTIRMLMYRVCISQETLVFISLTLHIITFHSWLKL